MSSSDPEVGSDTSLNAGKSSTQKRIDLDSNKLNEGRSFEVHVAKDALQDRGEDSPVQSKASTYSCPTFMSIIGTFKLKTMLYLSAFSILGVCLRVWLGQVFDGYITADGRGEQQGGSLFSDLPANMLGSFIVGIVTSITSIKFQQHVFVGWKTGFCGSLTTFASWNSQMVVMMDGSVNNQLSSQIGTALFGYLIGTELAIMSYKMGKDFAAYLDYFFAYLKRKSCILQSQQTELISDGNEPISDDFKEDSCSGSMFYKGVKCILDLSPFILSLLLILLFGLRDHHNLRASLDDLTGNPIQRTLFFQKMWLSCLFAPFGTILRWKLSELNNKNNTIISPIVKILNCPDWIPYGTLLANLLGSIVSIIAVGITDRLLLQGKTGKLGAIDNIKGQFLLSFLGALKTGFAGCLSTVSTFVSEIDGFLEASEKDFQGYLYAIISICVACVIGLCIYLPLVRVL